jgi:hypothetical protein
VEERRKLISYSAIRFYGCVNAEQTSMETITIITEELCQSVKSGNSKVNGDSDIKDDDNLKF